MRVAVTLTVLMMLAWAAPSLGQDRHAGVKAGPAFGLLSLDGEEGAEYDRRIAPAGGGFLVLPVRRAMSIQLEGLFSPRGARLYDGELGLTSTLLLNYIDVPVLARIDVPRSFHVFAGPYAGVRTSATRQISAGGLGFSSGYRENMAGEVDRFDWGLVAGGGLHIGRRTVVDARYAWGLRDVNTDRSLGLRFRHRALTIMGGVRF